MNRKKHLYRSYYSSPIFKVLAALLLTALLVLPAASTALAKPAIDEEETTDSTSDSDEEQVQTSDGTYLQVNGTVFDDIKMIDVDYPSVYATTSHYTFPYTDEFFTQPDNEYCHLLAQASLGMTVSAFKSSTLNHECSDNITKYFENIGFGNVSAEPFNSTPTADSITYAIASKEIDNLTVIAVICCGAGYGAEWSSNLTVGNDERHDGFNDSAIIVENAIQEYINSNNISGTLVMWTSGFSRASAVANIVAADMTDSDLFRRVYAYTYATPRTTCDGGDYDNIFNIIGKDDPVPSIPFADWGYVRYGIDLYTPTIETDSDFSDKVEKVSAIMQEIETYPYTHNPELAAQIRTFFDYLLELMPSAEDYSIYLQPGVLQVLADGSTDNILSLVEKIVTTFIPKTSQEKIEVNNLIEYIQELANQYVLKGNQEQIDSGYWDSSLDITQNLTKEHNPTRYIAWMFCGDSPEDVFGPNTIYVKFTIKGDVTINMYNDNGYTGTIKDGEFAYDDTLTDSQYNKEHINVPYIQYGSGQTNIVIPGDANYKLVLTSDKKQTVEYYGISGTNDSVRYNIKDIYSLDMQANEKYTLKFPASTALWEDDCGGLATSNSVWTSSGIYSPTTILKLQKINVLHLTLKEVAILAGVLIIFVYTELVVLIVLGIVRAITRRPPKSGSAIAVHVANAAIFLGLEIGMWYFVPVYPFLKTISKLISFLMILLLALMTLRYHRCLRNTLMIMGLIIAMGASFIYESNLMTRVNSTNLLIKIAFYAVMCVVASLCWMGHGKRRAAKITAIYAEIAVANQAKAQKDIDKAAAKYEKKSLKSLERYKKRKARIKTRKQENARAIEKESEEFDDM